MSLIHYFPNSHYSRHREGFGCKFKDQWSGAADLHVGKRERRQEMKNVAHVLALLVAWIVWQKIGGFGGLIIAVLAVGLIEIVFIGILGLLSSPFSKKQPDHKDQGVMPSEIVEGKDDKQ
jgi:hypothetical protein